VSQCSGGQWREKVNQEMLAAQHLYEQNVKVTIANADDDTQRQIRQIDSLVASGIDLLVVAPNEAGPIAEAITRVMEQGIPVICFDRKVASDNYTAFIGGSNVEAGRAIGVNAVDVARGLLAGGHKPLILEVTASMSSTPAQERHQGFAGVVEGHPELDYVWRESDWSSEGTYRIVMEQIRSGRLPDIVFCHNDGMATGAYKAVVETGTEGKVNIMGLCAVRPPAGQLSLSHGRRPHHPSGPRHPHWQALRAGEHPAGHTGGEGERLAHRRDHQRAAATDGAVGHHPGQA